MKEIIYEQDMNVDDIRKSFSILNLFFIDSLNVIKSTI